MDISDKDFKEKIYSLVAAIPVGKFMTYGQLAALAGKPRAAWEVGQIAHFGPTNLPWHRVVNKQGRLASGWPGGIHIHKELVESEGVAVGDDYHIDIAQLQWWPQQDA